MTMVIIVKIFYIIQNIDLLTQADNQMTIDCYHCTIVFSYNIIIIELYLYTILSCIYVFLYDITIYLKYCILNIFLNMLHKNNIIILQLYNHWSHKWNTLNIQNSTSAICAQRGARIHGPKIKSLVFYRLS